jgi:hypothetical protein
MVVRDGFTKTAKTAKTAFVFSSTLAMSLMVSTLPSFAQVQPSESSTSAEPAQSIQAPANLSADESLPAQVPSNPEIPLPSLETADLEKLSLETDDLETVGLEELPLKADDSETVTAEAPSVESTVDSSVVSDEKAESFDNAAQTAESIEDGESAMAELAEALNADMAEIQAMASPVAGIAAQTAEQTEAALPPPPGASAIGSLNSVSLADHPLLAPVAGRNPAALSALSASAGSANPSSNDPLSALEADSVPALKAALSSDNTLTQLYAADALWSLTGDSDLVLPTLISAATSGRLETRELAAMGLSYLGRQALPAIPFLNRLLSDDDSRVRRIAEATKEIVESENRPATTLGILSRETRRQGILPTALSILNFLWR